MTAYINRTTENLEMVWANRRNFGYEEHFDSFSANGAYRAASRGNGFCKELGLSFNAIRAILDGYMMREDAHAMGYTDDQLSGMPRVKHHVVIEDPYTHSVTGERFGGRTMMYRSFFKIA